MPGNTSARTERGKRIYRREWRVLREFLPKEGGGLIQLGAGHHTASRLILDKLKTTV